MVSEFRYIEAHPKGGLNLNEDDKSRSIVSEILKTLGRKIMEGNFTDIMKISRPASISYPMSFLQAASRDFSYSYFLTQAALESDPIVKLQYVCTFVVAGLHINPVEFKNTPPLNPILGETFTAEMEDGSKIWLEQTCHHPPITHWYMVGPNESYKFHGYGQIKAGLAGPNTIKASKIGKHLIEFENGEVIEYAAPSMKICGVVFGQRNVNFEGTFSVTFPKYQLEALFTFEEDEGVMGSIAEKIKGLWAKSNKLPSDFFKVVIRRTVEGEVEELSTGFGSWLEYIQFGERMWWNIGMKPTDEWRLSRDHLPSDSSYREDLQFLLNSDIEAAQRAKDDLENIQRRDRDLRNAINKDNLR